LKTKFITTFLTDCRLDTTLHYRLDQNKPTWTPGPADT
jgi:hypothetical protein